MAHDKFLVLKETTETKLADVTSLIVSRAPLETIVLKAQLFQKFVHLVSTVLPLLGTHSHALLGLSIIAVAFISSKTVLLVLLDGEFILI
jgi:hypothetical protein